MSLQHTPQAPHSHPEVSPKDSFILGLGFAWELGYTIAVPAVLLGLGGGWLDKNVFGTSPLFLLVGLMVAFVISFSIVAQKLRVIAAKMPKDLPKKKKTVDPIFNAEEQALHELFRPPSDK